MYKNNNPGAIPSCISVCGTEVQLSPSLPPKCMLVHQGRFDGNGYEPSEAPELFSVVNSKMTEIITLS